jgi:hypothetical protein
LDYFLAQIAGCVLTGVASWGVKYNSALHDAVPPSGVVPFIVAGVFLMVTALIGFIGGCFNHAVGGLSPDIASKPWLEM